MEKPWHSANVEEIGRNLSSDFEKGLSDARVLEQRKIHGENVLPEGKKKRWWMLLLGQFKNTLVTILLVAALLTFSIAEYLDTTVITIAVLINVLIGFLQEYRSNTIFEKLLALVRIVATVKRGWMWVEVNGSELVPGDLILLKAGEKVPADARIVKQNHLACVEALLTGESVPVKKSTDILPEDTALADRRNMVYAGTTIDEGDGAAVVVATGAHTEIGRIAELTASAEDALTPLQERLERLTKVITIIVGVTAAIIFVTGLLESQPFVEMFMITVAVAVAAIPEGLPAALSVVLAVASKKILAKNGLVKTLIGAETLGSTSVICTDKTGTLTEGVMKMEEIEESDDEDRARIALAMANEAVLLGNGEIKGESTDRSKLEYFLSRGGDMEKSMALYPRRALLPFDQVAKCILSFHQREGEKTRLFVTGVPEHILDRSTKSSSEKERVHRVITELAERGFRLIGIAERELSETALDFDDVDILRGKLELLHFLGIAAIRDPIRNDVGASLAASREAGIRTIVITGDHPITSRSIGRELGFVASEETMLTGQQLDLLSEADLSKKMEVLEIVARATPENKMRIIAALKKRGDIVAMTGDGVNDAPALKAADVGVALGSGTDVTKEAADIVLINDGFSTITEAIRQGRVAFDNVRKVVIFLLANSFTELILVLITLIFNAPLPITAVQILWANMVEDGLPNFALAFEHGEKNIMKRKPIAKNESIINSYGWAVIFLQGIVTDILVVAVYFLYLEFSEFSIEHIRTLIFAIITADSLLFVFSIKSSGQSIFKTNFLDNKYLLGAVGVGFLLMFASVYAPVLNRLLETVPLHSLDLAVVFGVGVFKIIIIESIKWFFRRKKERQNAFPAALRTV